MARKSRPGTAAPPPEPARSPARRALERRSVGVLTWLHGLPRPVVALGGAAVVAGGLLVQGVAGALLLLAVAAVVTWLAALAWPVLRPVPRAIRIAVVVVIVVAAVQRLA